MIAISVIAGRELTRVIGYEPVSADADSGGEMGGVGRPEPVSAGQGGGEFCGCPVDRPQVESAQETGKGAYLVGSTVAEGLAQYLGQEQDRPGADWVPAAPACSSTATRRPSGWPGTAA
jgi:hypothetical protein